MMHNDFLLPHYTGTEHCNIMSELCSLAKNGNLKPPLCSEFPLTDENHHIALEKSMESYIGNKQMFLMQN